MRTKAFAVIDTNVLVAGMLSPSGAPRQIMELVKTGNVIPIFDKRMLCEYHTVFNYEHLHIPDDIQKEVLYLIIDRGIYMTDVTKTTEVFKDKTDIPFFEVKISSEDFNSLLVTGNVKDYPEKEQHRTVITPSNFMVVLDQLERFVTHDIEYEKVVQEVIDSNLEKDKYRKGEDILEEVYDDVKEHEVNRDHFGLDL